MDRLDHQPLTIVLISPDQHGQPGPALQRAIYSVQQQRGYPAEMIDVMLIQDVGQLTRTELRTFAVNKANTEWVVFMEEDDCWSEDRLTTLWDLLNHALRQGHHGVAVEHPQTHTMTTIVDREYYLHQIEVES